MPIITALLSGATPYIVGLMLLLSAVAGGYGLYERAQAEEASAKVAAQSATINEQQATIDADAKAYAELARIKDLDETVIAHAANATAAIQSTLTTAETKVIHVKVPADCQSADARDAAALDGLRRIIAGTAAADPDGHGQGTAADGAAGLPASAGDSDDARQP